MGRWGAHPFLIQSQPQLWWIDCQGQGWEVRPVSCTSALQLLALCGWSSWWTSPSLSFSCKLLQTQKTLVKTEQHGVEKLCHLACPQKKQDAVPLSWVNAVWQPNFIPTEYASLPFLFCMFMLALGQRHKTWHSPGAEPGLALLCGPSPVTTSPSPVFLRCAEINSGPCPHPTPHSLKMGYLLFDV
jgi:hypothetical protein